MAWILRVVAFLVAAVPALASGDCALPEMRTDIRPGTGAGPTEVTAHVVVLDVLGIDDANQQVTLDFAIFLDWTDPRLAGPEGCRFPVTAVWFPELYLLNSSNLRQLRTQARDQVSVGPEGRVSHVQRFTGDVSSYHSLRDFPFDSHNLEIAMMPVRDQRSDLVLVADDARSGLGRRLNIEGWDISGVRLTEQPFSPLVQEGEYSLLLLTIAAARESSYYVYRLILPLTLVVAMSWAIFWVPRDRYEFRIGLGATSMLTAIAFALSMAGRLPTLGYLTVLDRMLIWAIALIFLTIVEAVVVGRLLHANRENRARSLDRACRVAFPCLLVGGWAVTLL